tara:strand:+ start:10807 stop:18357 length:7551 start_codon:yes stop_codon:yes gene_type:complete
MSIKDLFSNYHNKQHTKPETVASSSVLLESPEYIAAKQEEFDRFIPDIDFSSASNFAKFGSAELYYDTAFKRIYQEYPYDGTLAEKQEFENQSSYLDRYVFDNLYPRTNGYVVFSNQGTAKADANPAGGNYTNPTVKEYILIHGGPHTASAGMIGSTLHSKFEDSGIYDVSSRRGSSLEVTMASGSTIEFWMKKPTAMDIQREDIFDLHNGEASGSAYGRMKLYVTSSDQSLYMTLISGSDGFQDVRLMTGMFDGNWNHHAVTLITSSVGTQVKVYKNNKLINSFVSGGVSDIAPVNKGLIATIGAASRDDHVGHGDIGFNKLSASLDEFRFWKTERSHKEIDNCWFRPIGGGSNEHDSNVDLGVYYKFNEGTTSNSVYDATVLDYSGRMADGMWVGYASGARSSGSAMVESGVTVREFQDPIIYSSHPEVSSSIARYKTSGSLSDIENPSMFYRLFPSWMQEEDTEQSGQLKTLSHMIGSYFDTIWHQTNEINKIKHHRYLSGSNKAYPFASNILYSRGFVFPELFSSAKNVELFLNRDNNEIYEKNIEEVKNSLYHNINLGLVSMYKSKGTMKSFRNFFRSLGLNKEIVTLNMYADESTHILKDNYYNDTVTKKYLNFYSENNMSATVYGMSSSTNSNTYVAAPQNYSSITLETNLLLPKKRHPSDINFLETNFLTSSIAGFHTADTNLISFPETDYEMGIYIYKEKQDSLLFEKEKPRIKFALSSSALPFVLTSSYIGAQYDNNKWNLAVKVKHDSYPYGNFVTGATGTGYTVEFYGVEAEGRTKRNSFSLTGSVTGHNLVASAKRFYVGAHRQNFTGSVLCQTDIKIGSLLHWNSYIPDHVIDEHCYDQENYGLNDSYTTDVISNTGIKIPRSDTLALHWSFDTITGSNAAGNMRVYDYSSGSSDAKYGDVSNVISRMHEGYGAFFANSDTNCVDKNYIYVAKKRNIDNLYTDDKVSIETDYTEHFFTDNDVNDVVYSFEKSLYGVISSEMMNMFSTAADFNNLIGRPNQKYHTDYNKMAVLKNMFFDKVENDPDIERYLSFYKWIDDSISEAIRQLIPAGVKFNDKIYDVIESHALERNKYLNQTNLLVERAFTKENFAGPMRGVKELLYSWQDGSAPTGSLDREDRNCLWLRDRQVKNETTRPTSTSAVREAIRTIKTNHSLASSGLLRTDTDGSTYIGSTYAIRKLAKPYNFTAVQKQIMHGGINFRTNKNKFLLLEALAPHGEELSVPQNIVTIGVGTGTGLEIPQDCDDPNRSVMSFLKGRASNQKTFWNSQAILGKFAGDEYREKLKGDRIVPYNFVEDIVHTGYNKEIKSFFGPDVVVTNIHPDVTYLSNDIPMQGPFTEAHVGGHQSRHVDINSYSADKSLTVRYHVGASQATGSIRFLQNVIAPGTSVTIQDSDQSKIVATYSKFYDLKDGNWTSAEELTNIISHHLDVGVNVYSKSPVILGLTQSAWGTDGNRTIVASATTITASGFGGGANASSTNTRTVNLDSTANRPEAWAIVAKTHATVNDTDGALGFVGPDYGGSYPNQVKPWAIRFRDEHAKRPVNIRNIQFNSKIQKVGNYRKGYELFTLNKSDQRRWYRDAYDAGLDLPEFTKNLLPNTTNYMSLFGQEFFTDSTKGKGNVFGSHPNNRQPDGTLLVSKVDSKGEFVATGSFFAGRAASGSFAVTGAFYQIHATGSFKVLGAGYHAPADYLTITTATLGGETNKYGVSGSHDPGIVNRPVNKGASDTDFYNNLSSSIHTHSGLASIYTSNAAVYSQSLKVSKRNTSFMSASITSRQIWIGAWTLSFWVNLDAGTGGRRSIYLEGSDVGVNKAREVYIDSAGRLRLFVHYRKFSEGVYTNAYDQYYIEDFDDYAGKEAHVVWTHSGSVNSTTEGSLYIDGVKQTLITNAGGTGASNVINQPTELIMFNEATSATTTTLSNGGNSYIDEIVILNTTASQAAVNLLFNDAQWLNLNKTVSDGCIIPSSSITQYYSFETDANVNDEGTVDCLGSAALDLTINNVATNFSLASGSAGAVLSELPYAAFTLLGPTGSGAKSNGNVDASGSAFYAASDMANGADNGAVDNDSLTIAGTYVFHIDKDGTSDSGNNFYIQNTGSSEQMWHILETKIEALAGGAYTVNRSSTGAQIATFHITASAVGAGLNSTLAESGTSYSSLNNIVGGQGSGGAVDGHKVIFTSGSGAAVNFIFDDDNTSDSSPNFYIQNTGSNAQIWHMLETKILANTGITSISRDTSAYPNAAVFRLTSSTLDSYTLTYNNGGVGGAASFHTFTNVGGGIHEKRARDLVITVPRTDLTASTFEINTRFSAPGGPEVQTDGYLDVAGKSFSVHNALPYRNLTVRGSGSGEKGTIRMYDHIGRRRGLKSLLAIPMGRFGTDSQFPDMNSDKYSTSGSFHKYHRNTSYRYEYSGDSIITGSRNDNAYIGSTLPRSDFQYSWIRNSVSGSDWKRLQNINGYAPRSGLVSASLKAWKVNDDLPDASNSYVGTPISPPTAWIPAINFPSASTIYGG